MMRKGTLILCIHFFFHLAYAGPPKVTNVRASQQLGSQSVDIYYDVSADGPVVNVYFLGSGDGGATWSLPVVYVTGQAGAGVPVGSGRRAVWNAGADWPENFSAKCKLRVIAYDNAGPSAPNGMVFVPGGKFSMGDPEIGGPGPKHDVTVSPFFMDKYEMTKELWDGVCEWANDHGYSMGRAATVPFPVTWYEAVIWCNARSEKEGLTPVYYSDLQQTQVFRAQPILDSQVPKLLNGNVRWSANGYRLPTEAEWEYAARGGGHSVKYSYGDSFDESISSQGWGVTGRFPPNVLGLYDFSGNGSEWCWDAADAYPATPQTNPRGPDFPERVDNRTVRDPAVFSGTGGWPKYLCGARSYSQPVGRNITFRTVRVIQ